MQLPMVFLALLVGPSLAGFILDVSNGNRTSRLVQATIKILKSCYGNQGNAVGLVGDADGILIRTLFQQSTPVALINNKTGISGNGPVKQKSRYRLQVFVVVAASSMELKDILNKFKDSIWWNHLAPILILNWPPESEYDCSNAYKMLWSAWEINLLNAKFMCLHPEQGHMIYGYNPYTKKAPNLWELQETHRGKNDHPWTLFSRRFQENKQVCEELDFDKTRDLGGYEILSTIAPWPEMWSIDFNKSGNEALGGMVGNVAKILYRAMNASCKMVLHNVTEDNMSYENGTDFALDVLNGRSDIMLNPRYQVTMINFTFTYPRWISGLGVMTQFSGYVSQLGKINSVIDKNSRRGVCLVFLVTLVFFKCFLHQDVSQAILNNIRILCNGSILKVPQNQAARIYLAGLFIFALTILALYQGQLASLLTKPVSLPNVNTLQDLIDSNYTIYGYKAHAEFFNDPVFNGRYMKVDEFSCSKYVLMNASASCVEDWQFMVDTAATYNLYLSAESITDDYNIHPIRRDWPLEDRVNVVLGKLVEADLVNYWYTKEFLRKMDRLKYFVKLKEDQKFEVMTLNELSFAFAILAIGLASATAVFIVEVLITRALLGFTNVLVHICNRLGMANK